MSNIKILAQYIKNLSFNAPQTPEVFLQQQEKPDIKISIDIDAKKIAAENFEITLKISANASTKNSKLFNCELSYGGLFLLKNIEGEMLEQVLLIYCPNLLFPFLRRIITNATSDAGFAPLMLDPIDFAELYARRKAAEKATPVNDTTQ
jgi:preprotein translocase subunit SecB